jgi:hypothetical protein
VLKVKAAFYCIEPMARIAGEVDANGRPIHGPVFSAEIRGFTDVPVPARVAMGGRVGMTSEQVVDLEPPPRIENLLGIPRPWGIARATIIRRKNRAREYHPELSDRSTVPSESETLKESQEPFLDLLM